MDEDNDSGLSVWIIVIIVFFFILLLILFLVYFFRSPSSPTSGTTGPQGPPGPQGPQGPPGESYGLNNYSFEIVTPATGSGTIFVPINILYNYNFAATISVANGLIGDYRSIFPPSGPDSDVQLRYNIEERSGQLLIHFYEGTPANLPALLNVTVFSEKEPVILPINIRTLNATGTSFVPPGINVNTANIRISGTGGYRRRR